MLYTNYIFKWSMFHCYVSFPGVWDWHPKNRIPLFQSFKKNRVKQGIFGDLYLMSQLKKLAIFTGGWWWLSRGIISWSPHSVRWVKLQKFPTKQLQVKTSYCWWWWLRPRKLTWTLKIMVSNRNLLFQGSIFRLILLMVQKSCDDQLR